MRLLININDSYTRFEANGKKFAIFKSFYLWELSTGNCFESDSKTWLFAEYKETLESECEVLEPMLSFNTLQNAFNYAESRNLEFY